MSTELAISASLSHDLVLGLDWYSSVCAAAPQILGLLTLAALDLHLPLSTAVSGSVSVMPDTIAAPASHSSTPSTRGVDDVSTPCTRRFNTRTRDVLDNNDFITHENETVTSSFHDPFVMLSNSDKTLVICYHVNEKCVPAAELRKLVAHHQVNIYKIAETLRFEFIGRKYARSAGLYTAGGSSFFSSTARVFPRPCNWSPIPRKRPRLPLATDSTLSEFPIILTRQQKDDIVTEFRPSRRGSRVKAESTQYYTSRQNPEGSAPPRKRHNPRSCLEDVVKNKDCNVGTSAAQPLVACGSAELSRNSRVPLSFSLAAQTVNKIHHAPV
ncbi:hypothetical protein FB45DRAFT_1082445 [Roridomyces roridus]|uniref:Uncharacterized protein n=1 Tax=Roridomyces roridus TaxID=1738132 RepID=A0AAD7FMH3_9AGAR|nr:hypothetical protein FB45DRAFT_1082445 [Roridomyces roridus]